MAKSIVNMARGILRVEYGTRHNPQPEEEAMMGAKSTFFLQVYRRNGARQRWREERDALGRSQSLPPQSQEPGRNLERKNGENGRIKPELAQAQTKVEEDR
jgi:hypothetical protein